MSGKYLLDTNVIIALLKPDETVKVKIDQMPDCFVCSIVVGELHFGAQNSTQVQSNVARIERALQEFPSLVCDEDTARVYGLVKKQLRDLGRPTPENDIWIAATSIQHGLTLVTFDHHFDHVPDLELERW
jgi:tRNA(fMet)-specific endonuclease VapC